VPKGPASWLHSIFLFYAYCYVLTHLSHLYLHIRIRKWRENYAYALPIYHLVCIIFNQNVSDNFGEGLRGTRLIEIEDRSGIRKVEKHCFNWPHLIITRLVQCYVIFAVDATLYLPPYVNCCLFPVPEFCGNLTRTTGVRSPIETKNYSSSLCVQAGSEAHSASCTMDIGVSFP
jgi:hypothetical protein